jgi:hypothetical protein
MFDVILEKSYTADFEEFVTELEERIVSSKKPNQAPEPTPGSVTPRAK